MDRKARMGRNPATGQSIQIPARGVLRFRVAKAAKDTLDQPGLERKADADADAA